MSLCPKVRFGRDACLFKKLLNLILTMKAFLTFLCCFFTVAFSLPAQTLLEGYVRDMEWHFGSSCDRDAPRYP